MFEEVLNRYCEHFNVGGIPTHLFLGVAEDELIAMMEKAIATNEEIKPEFDPDCDY